MDPAVDPKSNASHPPESESKPNETTTHPPPPPPSDAPPSDPQSTVQMAPVTLHHVPDTAQTLSDPQSTAQMKSDYVPDTDQLRSDTQSTAQMYPSISAESNPYVAQAPIQSSSSKNTMETVKGVLSRWGKKVGVATKKAEDLSRNTWQHLRTGPSIADVALGRIAQGSKVIAEGGYDKIFRNTFETLPDENLRKCYACYLSTSAGPVMGVLYISTVKIAFCSDAPLSYKVGDKTEWSYYKVAIPLNQLRGVNPSLSEVNQAEKFIQIISIDSHEFWFMGFVNYDSAVKNLQQVLPQIHPHLQP